MACHAGIGPEALLLWKSRSLQTEGCQDREYLRWWSVVGQTWSIYGSFDYSVDVISVALTSRIEQGAGPFSRRYSFQER